MTEDPITAGIKNVNFQLKKNAKFTIPFHIEMYVSIQKWLLYDFLPKEKEKILRKNFISRIDRVFEFRRTEARKSQPSKRIAYK